MCYYDIVSGMATSRLNKRMAQQHLDPDEVYSFNSSNIDSAQYDWESRELIVNFVGGRSYRYDGVPEQVVRDWLFASSAGHYHATHIKWDYHFTEL